MKPKTVIFLVVLLLAMMGAIIARQLELGPDQPATKSNSVWQEHIGTVKAVTVSAAEEKSYRFERSDAGWRIVEPIQAPAQTWQVDSLADPIKDLRYLRTFQPGDLDAPDKELTGLDQPRWKLTLTDQGGKDHVLLVGKPVPLSDGRQTYVRPDGAQGGFVVEMDFADRLDKPISDFRDKTVLNVERGDVARISLVGRERIELARTNGVWGVTEPVSTAANDTKVDALLDRAFHLVAEQFVDDNPQNLRQYGLESGEERLVLRIWTKPLQASTQPASGTAPASQAASEPASQPAGPAKTYGLALGVKTEQTRYAKLLDSPSVFLVRAELLDDLQVSLDDLRDKQVMPVVVEQVLRLDLNLPAGKAELARQDGVWRMTSPYKGDANGEAVDKMLSDLNNLQAETIRDDADVLARFGLETPAGTITVHQAGKSDKQVLLIGAASPSGEMTFLRRASANSVAVVKTASLTPVVADPAGYWAARVLQVPADMEVSELRIRRSDLSASGKQAGGAPRPGQSAVELELARQDGAWRLKTPLQAGADAINVEKLLAKVTDLSAEKIVALGKSVPAEYAGAKERIEISLTAVQRRRQPTTAGSQPATIPALLATSLPASLPAPLAAPLPASLPASQPASKPAEPRSYQLVLANVGGKTYAWTPGAAPAAVGLCYGGVWDALTAELRDRLVWQMAAEQITAISLAAGAERLELAKQNDRWQYTADPLVKIDSAKVSNFLNSISQLQADKYAAYAPAGPADDKRFGLDKPWFTLTLTDVDGGSRQLVVSSEGDDKALNRYAREAKTQGVLVISNDQTGRMAVGLKDFKQ